jgi:hypothetical protein
MKVHLVKMAIHDLGVGLNMTSDPWFLAKTEKKPMTNHPNHCIVLFVFLCLCLKPRETGQKIQTIVLL